MLKEKCMVVMCVCRVFFHRYATAEVSAFVVSQ